MLAGLRLRLASNNGPPRGWHPATIQKPTEVTQLDDSSRRPRPAGRGNGVVPKANSRIVRGSVWDTGILIADEVAHPRKIISSAGKPLGKRASSSLKSQ
jgi:hypothetical protein